MKIILTFILQFAVSYGCTWVFNHTNAWLGIALFIAQIFVFIKLYVQQTKQFLKNETKK